ncbi:hypothetical protein [Niveispirillum fermenti]|uniref:hypothetical protein n=1 Tax=Niveispirillum fermenti TaxID=1233113 RepID=UPI003A866B2F
MTLSALALMAFLPGSAIARPCPVAGEQDPFDLVAEFVGKTWRGEELRRGGEEQGSALIDVAAWEWALGKRAIRITHMLLSGGPGPGPHGGETLILRDADTGALVSQYVSLSGLRTQGRVCVERHGRLVMEEDVTNHPHFSKIRSTMTLSGDVMTSQAETFSNGKWSRISTMLYKVTDPASRPEFPPAQ